MGLRSSTLKKRLWHKCFPVNFVNSFHRTPLSDCFFLLTFTRIIGKWYKHPIICFSVKYILRFQNWSFVSGTEISFPNCYSNLDLKLRFQLVMTIQIRNFVSRIEAYTAQKMKFSIKDFLSKGNCGFGHIYWRNP